MGLGLPGVKSIDRGIKDVRRFAVVDLGQGRDISMAAPVGLQTRRLRMNRADRRQPRPIARPGAACFAGAGALLPGALLTLTPAQPAAADNWPTRPIKLINPLAAGSAPDLLSRII